MNNLRASLPAGAKKCLWNIKYGLLRYPRLGPAEDAVNYLSDRLSTNRELLELGCGRGSLLSGLRQTGWTGHYCGVDISERAINEGRALQDQRSSWVVSDFESFRSPFDWDAIALIESLYYVRLEFVPAFVLRLSQMLTTDGLLLIRLHDMQKHSLYVQAVRKQLPMTECVGTNLLASVRSVLPSATNCAGRIK
jgi:SAM-dependent methyltransferase